MPVKPVDSDLTIRPLYTRLAPAKLRAEQPKRQDGLSAMQQVLDAPLQTRQQIETATQMIADLLNNGHSQDPDVLGALNDAYARLETALKRHPPTADEKFVIEALRSSVGDDSTARQRALSRIGGNLGTMRWFARGLRDNRPLHPDLRAALEHTNRHIVQLDDGLALSALPQHQLPEDDDPVPTYTQGP